MVEPSIGSRLFPALSASSMLLCLAAGGLWVRSDSRSRDEFSTVVPLSGDRLTVRIEPGGRLVVFVPPRHPVDPPPPARLPPHRDMPEFLAGRLLNDQVYWRTSHALPRPFGNGWDPPGPDEVVGPRLSFRSPAQRLAAGHARQLFGSQVIYPKADLLPLLLRALEDPGRFLAAHVALVEITGSTDQIRPATPTVEPSFLQNVDGLTVEIWPDPDRPAYLESTPGGSLEWRWCVSRADPTQFSAIRTQWHRRLDRTATSVSLAWAVTPAAAMLGLSLLARRRTRRLRASGCCAACGYDLRATLARCPECGAIPAR